MKLLLWFCTLPLVAFQVPTVAPAKKGAIEGRVLNALSGEPLRRVALTLSKMGGTQEAATLQAEADGHFAFRDLDPGTYHLTGERTGFERQAYGPRLDSFSGAPLRLTAGQQIKDLVFKLAPNAVISGRVIDDAGEPMPNLMLTPYKKMYASGKLQWQPSGSSQTNDRGEFRLPGLRAGHYVISAKDMNIGIGLAGVNKDPLTDKSEPGYTVTYFGNTTDIARATPVDVTMGEDHRGTDIRMIKASTMRVRGKLIGGPPDKPMLVTLTRRGWSGTGATQAGFGLAQPNDGSFEIRGLTSGSYLLEARGITEAAGPASASMPIELSDHHLEGVELRMGEAFSVAGSIVNSGMKADSMKTVSVRLESIDYFASNSPSATPLPDGSFVLKGVFAGRYRLRVTLPQDAYVKSLKMGGQDADMDAIEITSSPGKLDIVASNSGARVDGTVTGMDDKALAGATIVLIPASKNESQYRITTSHYDGFFRLDGVRPGKYKVLAWEEMEPGAYLDAEFVKPFEGGAESLTLEESGRSKLTLKAIMLEQPRTKRTQ